MSAPGCLMCKAPLPWWRRRRRALWARVCADADACMARLDLAAGWDPVDLPAGVCACGVDAVPGPVYLPWDEWDPAVQDFRCPACDDVWTERA